MFTKEQSYLVIEAINHSVAYRLNKGTRLSEVNQLLTAKRLIEEQMKRSRENENH